MTTVTVFKRKRGRPAKYAPAATGAPAPRHTSRVTFAGPAVPESEVPVRRLKPVRPDRGQFGQFDLLGVARCPLCRHEVVARMTARGPACVCPCSHPDEFFWGKGDRTSGTYTPATEQVLDRRPGR